MFSTSQYGGVGHPASVRPLAPQWWAHILFHCSRLHAIFSIVFEFILLVFVLYDIDLTVFGMALI